MRRRASVNLRFPAEDKAATSEVTSGQSSLPSCKPLLVWEIDPQMTEDKEHSRIRDIVVTTGDIPAVVIVDDDNSCVKSWWRQPESEVQQGPQEKSGPGWRSLLSRIQTLGSDWESSRISVDGKPWSVTLLSLDTVVVSVPDKRQLCVIRVNPHLEEQSVTNTQKEYWALATISDVTMAASVHWSSGFLPGCVDIIHLDGSILTTIHNPDSRPFVGVNYLHVTDSGAIVASGGITGTLTCVSQRGELKWTNASSVKWPCGVTSDELSRLYGVDYDSHIVWRLSSDNSKAYKFVTGEKHGVWWPVAVFVHDGHLYVTHNTSSSLLSFQQKISIFQV